MNIKSKRIFAVSTIIALTGLLVNPTFAEDLAPIVVTAEETATIVSTAETLTTGSILIKHIVVNDNLGSKTAADFEFTIKHFGTNVEGSPFNVTEASGTNFTLIPGTYVIAVAPVDGYLGMWIDEVRIGFVDLKAGQEVTLTRYTRDVGIATPDLPATEPTTDPVIGQSDVYSCNSFGSGMGTGNFLCTEPVTENGGLLPTTGTNWFNALALGLLLSAAGALAFRKSSLSR
jgi:LPXTG-motif cell wall-anchored protein